MVHLLELIEGSGLATWIRESPSLFAYTLILSLHAIGLSVVVGFNTAVALRMLGVAPNIPMEPLLSFFPWMYAGFWVNAISGLALLAASATSMFGNPMFFIKLGFIALAVINLRLLRIRVFGNAAALAAVPLATEGRVFAVASLVCWSGAIIAGRLTAYPYFVNSFLGIG